MKVFQLFVPGPMGGAEKVLLSGVRAMRSLDFDSEILAVQESRSPDHADTFIEEAKELALRTRSFPCRARLDLRLLRLLKGLFRDEKPDVIHSHGFKAALYGQLCAPKMTKHVMTHHGVTSHTLAVRIYERIELWTMKRCDQVIAVSETMGHQLAAKGIKRDKLSVIENLLSMQVASREVPQNTVLELVAVGRLGPEKGLNVLLDALATLPPELAYRLTVVGDGKEGESLAQQAERLGITKNINFVGFQRDVRGFMEQADVLAMPSLREGLPMTPIEACCMGLPVIGSRVGAIPALVHEGRNGFLSRPEDVQELVDNICQFNAQKHEVLTHAAHLSTAYQERFSPRKWASDTIALYTSVCSHL